MSSDGVPTDAAFLGLHGLLSFLVIVVSLGSLLDNYIKSCQVLEKFFSEIFHTLFKNELRKW